MIADQPRKTNDGVSTPSISPMDLCVLLREASMAARGLVGRLGLPGHEQEDLRQELLVDLISRLKWFDPARGTLSAFAGVIIRHRAGQLGKRINRERAIFAPMSLKVSSADDPNAAVAFDSLVEADEYNSWPAHPHDRFATIDRRLDLGRALGKLRPRDLSLCVKLAEQTPAELSRSGKFSRATLYRRLRNIRLRLLEEGISCP
jgi:DNA-directed RNA polymerase specialized sigma24 family protein